MSGPEFQLLLGCARTRPDPARIRGLAEAGVDWRVLLQLAERHGVRPLVYRSLHVACPDLMPQAVAREWQRTNRVITGRNMLMTVELLRLIETFQKNGLSVAAFKGPVSGEVLYGDFALREFSDIDLIVPKAEVIKAESILNSSGYQAAYPNKEYWAALERHHGQCEFKQRETGMTVDLHWRLSPTSTAFPIQAEEIWSRLEMVAVCGKPVPSFAPDDLALFLAAHGTKEGWRSLKWVCDFSEVLGKYSSLNWDCVLDRAGRAHSSRSVLLAALLASELLDASIPANWAEEARKDRSVQALAKRARERMTRTTESGELSEVLAGWGTHDRLMDRIRPLWGLLTTRTLAEYETMPLPRAWWWLYFVTRPLRVLLKMPHLILRSTSPGQGDLR